MNDSITGEPKAICFICGQHIPHGQAADIIGQDVCPDCESRIMDDQPPLHTTCPDCGAYIINDGGCWFCENKPR